MTEGERTTPQEAIEYLQDPLNKPMDEPIEATLKRHEEAVYMAVEALEKQIPLKTGPNELGISARNPVIIPCGYCGMELMDQMWKYCPWCGQRIER